MITKAKEKELIEFASWCVELNLTREQSKLFVKIVRKLLKEQRGNKK